MEVCESDGGMIWWDWDDYNSPVGRASAVNAVFQSVVPESEQRVSLVSAAYHPFSGADIALCGSEKNRDNDWEMSISASQDNKGNSEGNLDFSMTMETDSGLRMEASGGAGLKQDKEGNVQTEAHGRVSLGGSF